MALQPLPQVSLANQPKASLPSGKPAANGTASELTNDGTPKQSDVQAISEAEQLEPSAALNTADWVQVAGQAKSASRVRRFGRWRHAGLESILARPDARQQLRKALRSKSKLVAINAAIGLSCFNERDVLDTLGEAARSVQRKLPMRGAAIAAIANVDDSRADELIDQLFEELASMGGAEATRYNSELHVDLVQAIATRGESLHEPQLLAALASTTATVRAEAVRVYAAQPGRPLSERFAEAASDAAPTVRAAALTVLAARRHPEAEVMIERGLADYDLTVRLAAIECLGPLEGEWSHQRLRELLKDSAELIRAAAARGLAVPHDLQSLEDAVEDKSWRVRAAVAEALPEVNRRGRVELALGLLRDPSIEVQRRVVESVAEWPLGDAVPVWLAALEGRSRLVAQTAADQLRRRWAPAAQLTLHANADRVAQEVALLKEQWDRESPGRTNTASWDRVSRARRTSILDRTKVQPLLERLEFGATADRRAAARELAGLGENEMLGNDDLAGLAELAEREADGLVMADVLRLIANDPRPSAERIASAAASHPSPEVRRRACQYFGNHPSQSGAAVLIHSLEDNDVSVVRAAAGALGQQRATPEMEPLEKLLLAGDHTLRAEAAKSLARLRSPRGVPALVRLTYDNDAKVRSMAASALGEILSARGNSDRHNTDERREVLGELVRLLDDRGEVRRAAMISLEKITGVTPAESVMEANQTLQSAGSAPATVSEQIAWWKAWWREQTER